MCPRSLLHVDREGGLDAVCGVLVAAVITFTVVLLVVKQSEGSILLQAVKTS